MENKNVKMYIGIGLLFLGILILIGIAVGSWEWNVVLKILAEGKWFFSAILLIVIGVSLFNTSRFD